tara:strand:+ start:30 stop:611 length:582 start_codon:yes stop_codon:yes gene_type:complete
MKKLLLLSTVLSICCPQAESDTAKSSFFQRIMKGKPDFSIGYQAPEGFKKTLIHARMDSKWGWLLYFQTNKWDDSRKNVHKTYNQDDILFGLTYNLTGKNLWFSASPLLGIGHGYNKWSDSEWRVNDFFYYDYPFIGNTITINLHRYFHLFIMQTINKKPEYLMYSNGETEILPLGTNYKWDSKYCIVWTVNF